MFGTNIPNHPLSTGFGFSDGDELNRINPQAFILPTASSMRSPGFFKKLLGITSAVAQRNA
jgi:hypothetical protein